MNATETRVLGCERCRKVPASRAEMPIELTRGLYMESHEGYALCHCNSCGQMYLEQYREFINWSGGDDEWWERWVPLTAEELSEVNRLFPNEAADYDEVPHLAAIMLRRGRLTEDPEGEFYWSEDSWDPSDLLPPE